MKRSVIKPADIEAATDLIHRTGAMQLNDIGTTYGWGRDYTRQVLRECQGIKARRVLRITHYMTSAEYGRRKKEAERLKGIRWNENRRKAKEALLALDRYEGVEDTADWPVNRAVVSAKYSTPIKVNAARWVFEWRPS